jgi:hypothetical protein
MAYLFPPNSPQTISVQAIRGQDVQYKLVPKDPTGAVVDLTGYSEFQSCGIPSTADARIYNADASNSHDLASATSMTFDDTGATILITKDGIAALKAACFGLAARVTHSAQIVVGSDTITLQLGTVNFTFVDNVAG